jgi:hypothetical protein
MTRDEAIEIARRHAKAKPESYYSEPFQPHEWVVDSIVAASAEIERLRKIEAAARKLDEAMTSHKHELLNLTLNSHGWDWAWDMLADALEPNYYSASLLTPNPQK